MKGNRLVWCGMGILLLCAVLSVTSVQSASEKAIKIGAIFDLTGTLAPLGEDSKRGALLALEQAGFKVAGRPIDFLFEDGASDPTTTLDKMRKLVETDKVAVTFGPVHSGCGEAIGGYMDRVKVPNLSISHHSDNMPLKRQWMWLSCGILRQGAYAGGLYAFEGAGFKTVATLGSDWVAGREFLAGFVQGFEEKGGKVVQQQWFPQGTKDYTSFVVALKPADAVVVFVTGAECLGFFRQYKELGGKAPLFAVASDPLSPSIAKQLGPLTRGMLARGNWFPTADTTGNKEFVQAYEKRWGEIPGEKSAGAYVTTQIIMKAIADAGGNTSAEPLKKALLNVSLDTIHGKITFTPDRVAVFTYPIVKVDDHLVPRVVARYAVSAEKAGDKMVVKLVNRVQ